MRHDIWDADLAAAPALIDVEQDLGAADIIALGFDAAVVQKVLRLVDLNEYKRRQAPVGVRISKRGFGRDRRYPVTSGWRMTD